MRFERSGGARYQFSAIAEVRGPSSGVRIGRVKDVSLGGSYIAMENPFSEHSELNLRISTETQSMECSAVVARSTHGIGMGVRFHPMRPESQRVLENWLTVAEAGARGQER